MSLRKLPPIFQGLTPSCLMFHNFDCSACTKNPQSETTYLTLNLTLEYVLLSSPLIATEWQWHEIYKLGIFFSNTSNKLLFKNPPKS